MPDGGAVPRDSHVSRYRDAGADLVAAYPFPVGDNASESMRATIEGLGSLLPAS